MDQGPEGGAAAATLESRKNAISSFQRFYRLPVTGTQLKSKGPSTPETHGIRAELTKRIAIQIYW